MLYNLKLPGRDDKVKVNSERAINKKDVVEFERVLFDAKDVHSGKEPGLTVQLSPHKPSTRPVTPIKVSKFPQ